MTDTVIKVENLSKRYRLGELHKQNNSFRGKVSHAFSTILQNTTVKISKPNSPSFQSNYLNAMLQAPCALPSSSDDNIWALRNVSFEVKRGEVIGIIGRNGAGKSTLLKILSRITKPTKGRAIIKGRVGSLLEVGTGFHPELTGRENIFLNGAILGMSKIEIKRKFDGIVNFAEIEKFIDTPVKRYSSGMYVRLAFAVSAHLNPEILLVDEVLAVGDSLFQKKCIGKMQNVSKEGRTVVFVSHNMDAVRRLCPKTIWIDHGFKKNFGATADIISKYILQNIKTTGVAKFSPPLHLANGMPVRLHTVQILNNIGKVTTHFSRRSSIIVQIEWENYESIYKPRIGFVLQTCDGFDVLTTMDANSWNVGELSPGRRISTGVIPDMLLNEGEYIISFGGDCPKGGNKNRGLGFNKSRTDAILKFEIEDDMTLPNKYYGQEGFRDERWTGVFLLNIKWRQTFFNNDKAIIKI